MHGSIVGPADTVAGASVGNGGNVGRGDSVGSGVAVGGGKVAVGMSACVWVMEINASATAVFAISSELMADVGAGPQAARVMMINIERIYRNFIFICSPRTHFYHKEHKGARRLLTAKHAKKKSLNLRDLSALRG